MVLIGIVLSMLMAFVASLILPWWWAVLLGPFVYCLLNKTFKAGKASFVGFLAIALLWLLLMYKESAPNGFIAADSVAQIVGAGSTLVLMGITALLGGVLGALAAWTGQSLRRAFR